ncbi:F0F1 ATP synthase subunit B [Reinekea thalattae]|uniref:ATP synthase subunit b n=1 Tax=Reinekea thalattae TaxID=2593301 RepID=A0A5C8ZBD7_9GAMM|nr:F0F1 ATP synthase subunit B [Reinekea thalattae]TXR54599.1 F0F1 ATP synthase subunit B [Reinekea thalattae]
MNFNATFIGQIIVFAIFVWLCAKFVWPPIIAAMNERQTKIAEGLDASDRAAKNLEVAQNEAASKLREAKAEAAEIIEQANRRASAIVDQAKADAEAEAQRIVDAAASDVDKERNLAREELRSKVATLTLAGAEKILQAEVDATKHNELLDKLAAEL